MIGLMIGLVGTGLDAGENECSPHDTDRVKGSVPVSPFQTSDSLAGRIQSFGMDRSRSVLWTCLSLDVFDLFRMRRKGKKDWVGG